MYALILAVVFSSAGMVFLLFKPVAEAREIPREEFINKLRLSKSVFDDFSYRVAEPFKNIWKNLLLPLFLKKSEKIVARFRISVLKTERLLLQLTNYIRGKRENGNNGHTPYWKDLNDFKNNLK